MSKSDLFSIKKFAKLLQIPESTLRYYDRIGLMPSAMRGENAYRYYSIKQVAIINVIRALQEFGIPLSEIKNILPKRSPEYILELFDKQIEVINRNMLNLDDVRKLLLDLQSIIYQALDVNEDIIYIQKIENIRIIRGELNCYDNGSDDFDALFKFYEYVRNNYPIVCFYYPVWGMFSEKRIQSRDWKYPDRYYIYSNLGNDFIPKSLYVVGYARCWYGQGGELYEKMLQYIEINEFKLCGDVYEEYPLNELCNVNEQEYLMRILMPVRKIGAERRSDEGASAKLYATV